MKYYMPTELYSGAGCVRANAAVFANYTRYYIVTGRHAAKKSGALDDVTAALKENGAEYEIFDEIGENPLLSVCMEAGRRAKAYAADCVIGIGGGSPLDAAKAVAAVAQNPHISDTDLFCADRLRPSLPLILVPTTSGTGSEVNPYAIMTLDGQGKKKTFNSPHSYAKYAFLDGEYLLTMPPLGALSCALDAFCHCLESYLSPKTTEISAMYALRGAELLWKELAVATPDGLHVTRGEAAQALMFASCCGGFAINTTGTGFPHPMGYNLTLHRGIPHGRACAAFTGEYVRNAATCPEGERRLAVFCGRLGTTVQELAKRIPYLGNVTFAMTEEEIERYISLVKTAGNFANCVCPIGEDQMRQIYRKLFLK